MMKIHQKELECWNKFKEASPCTPVLSESQIELLNTKAHAYSRWVQKHPHIHNLFNLVTFSGLFALLFFLNFYLFPHSSKLLSVALVALLNGFCIYSIIIYTLHAGAAHGALFKGSFAYARFMNLVGNHSNRLLFCDPLYYRQAHIKHHQFAGTPEDGAFTHFVDPQRFYISIIPLWGSLGFSDYKIHNGSSWTLSHTISQILGTLFIVAVVLNSYTSHSLAEIAFFVITSYSFAFLLDRLRESTEHNLTHTGKDGARSLGTGFWALLVGGGPWGQPCHLAHHLFPQLSWYHQILMHSHFQKIMNPEQKNYYLLEKGFCSYPLLFYKLLRKNHEIKNSLLT